VKQDLLVGVLLLCCIRDASAQTASSRVELRTSAAAAVTVAAQGSGKDVCPYVCGTIGGANVGATFAIWERITSTFSLGAEFSTARMVHGTQTLVVSGGTLDMRTAHRNTIVSGLLGWSILSGRARVVGGIGAARRRTVRIGVFNGGFPSLPQGEPVPPHDWTIVVPATEGGFDVDALTVGRLTIAPSLRLHYIFDRDEPDSVVRVQAVSPLELTTGLSFRWSF
jgi:hypothetical protein